MADALNANLSGPAFIVGGDSGLSIDATAIGARGICIGGGVSSWEGTNTTERHYQIGAGYEGTEGSLSTPCLRLNYNGFWRWRWLVGAGSRSVTVYFKQVSNVAIRPSIILKANSAIGLAADVESFAASDIDWTPATASFTSTGIGMVWVELHNNSLGHPPDPCFFDRISVI